MEIKTSHYIGFCFGVKRAIKIAKSRPDGSKKAYSLGPLIHNPKVVAELSSQGLGIAADLSKVGRGELLVIPSHGISPALKLEAESKEIHMVDATCPFVTKSQELVASLRNGGYRVLIAGENAHPEVRALLDCAGGRADIIKSAAEIAGMDLKNKKVSVIAQTTYSENKYLEILSALVNKGCKELRIFNTLCNETIRRQEDIRRVADEAEVMLVIGGRNSANTRRLAEICRGMEKRVYHIEDKKELRREWFENVRSVGISSGASTPDWIVNDVIEKLNQIRHCEPLTSKMSRAKQSIEVRQIASSALRASSQ